MTMIRTFPKGNHTRPKTVAPKSIISYGTMAGGYLFTGPFDSESEAVDFAEMYLNAYHWEILDLQHPDEVK